MKQTSNYDNDDIQQPNPIGLKKFQSDILNAKSHFPDILQRSHSYEDKHETLQTNRAFVLVNVINMGLDLRTAEIILQELDLNEDKSILLTQVSNRLIAYQELQKQKQESGIEHIKRKISGYTENISYFSKKDRQSQYQLLQEEESKLNKEECEICLGDFSLNELRQIPNCHHNFCKQCVQEYLQNKITIAEVLNIQCPKEGCLTMLEYAFLIQNVDLLHFLKYKKFLKVKILSSDTNLRWCPNGCERYVKGKEGDKKLHCQCGTDICFKCGNVYHGKQSCDSALDQTYKKAMKQLLNFIYIFLGFQSTLALNVGLPFRRMMVVIICNADLVSFSFAGYVNDSMLKGIIINGITFMDVQENNMPKLDHIDALEYRMFYGRSFCQQSGLILVPIGLVLAVILFLLSGFAGPMLLYMRLVKKSQHDKKSKLFQRTVYILWVVLGTILYPISMAVYALLLVGGILFILFKLLQKIFNLCQSKVKNLRR